MSAPVDYANAVQALVASLLGATVDPADGVRVMADLANLASIQSDAAPVAWAPAAAMQSAANDLFRRAAVVSLARATAKYQPSSSDDAFAVRELITGLLGAEIDIAGDQGEDATFNALRALSAAVVKDLTTRGAALPSIKQFSIAASLPAPVIAQMLYRDPGRAAELVSESDVIHPAFMPFSFKVLST